MDYIQDKNETPMLLVVCKLLSFMITALVSSEKWHDMASSHSPAYVLTMKNTKNIW